MNNNATTITTILVRFINIKKTFKTLRYVKILIILYNVPGSFFMYV